MTHSGVGGGAPDSPGGLRSGRSGGSEVLVYSRVPPYRPSRRREAIPQPARPRPAGVAAAAAHCAPAAAPGGARGVAAAAQHSRSSRAGPRLRLFPRRHRPGLTVSEGRAVRGNRVMPPPSLSARGSPRRARRRESRSVPGPYCGGGGVQCRRLGEQLRATPEPGGGGRSGTLVESSRLGRLLALFMAVSCDETQPWQSFGWSLRLLELGLAGFTPWVNIQCLCRHCSPSLLVWNSDLR